MLDIKILITILLFIHLVRNYKYKRISENKLFRVGYLIKVALCLPPRFPTARHRARKNFLKNVVNMGGLDFSCEIYTHVVRI